jgi:hypothetical protein
VLVRPPSCTSPCRTTSARSLRLRDAQRPETDLRVRDRLPVAASTTEPDAAFGEREVDRELRLVGDVEPHPHVLRSLERELPRSGREPGELEAAFGGEARHLHVDAERAGAFGGRRHEGAGRDGDAGVEHAPVHATPAARAVDEVVADGFALRDRDHVEVHAAEQGVDPLVDGRVAKRK